MTEFSRDPGRLEDEPAPLPKRVSLKHLAEYLGLNPATVSVVLNDVPGRSIPQATRDRVKAAAAKFNYHPSQLARSLRNQQTHTIGILVPELGDGYHAQVLSGMGDHLINAGYFYFTAHHRHQPHLVKQYAEMLISRGAQGIVAVDTALEEPLSVPVVAVAGHRVMPGVTNVVLDHGRAAELALHHLAELRHTRIAFMHGQRFSSDSEERWKNLVRVAERLRIGIDPRLVVALDRDLISPELGYPVVQQLLAAKRPFSALVAFNDISAIGSIRALEDLHIRVPQDVSVIGFDDIQSASYTLPRLTTIRQPLAEIGRVATECLLGRIHGTAQVEREIVVQPQLVVRESTAAVAEQSWLERRGAVSSGERAPV